MDLRIGLDWKKANSTESVRLDEYLLRRGMEDMRKQWEKLQQQQPNAQKWLIPPPAKWQLDQMPRVPLPREDRSKWIPKQFNSQTFYLVPCESVSATATTRSATMPAAGPDAGARYAKLLNPAAKRAQ